MSSGEEMLPYRPRPFLKNVDQNLTHAQTHGKPEVIPITWPVIDKNGNLYVPLQFPTEVANMITVEPPLTNHVADIRSDLTSNASQVHVEIEEVILDGGKSHDYNNHATKVQQFMLN